jgi:hypothetical protein
MSTIYDYQPSARDDPLIQIIEDAVVVSLEAMSSERAVLLEAFPFCKLSIISRKKSCHSVPSPSTEVT